jgi:hypothetical protein
MISKGTSNVGRQRATRQRHVAQHQVNIVYAALLMQRNASYIYEISISGSAVEYGYVVSVEGRGTKHEDVVRGTLNVEQVRCSNARIQNVFGGVQGADFIANDDMTSRCRSGNGKSMSDVRTEIFDAIADAVRRARISAALPTQINLTPCWNSTGAGEKHEIHTDPGCARP